MALIKVDVDLDEFDTDDLVSELVSRNQVSRQDNERLTRWLETTPFTGLETDRRTGTVALTEKWKIEFFNKNKHRVTLQQLEQFFDSLPIA